MDKRAPTVLIQNVFFFILRFSTLTLTAKLAQIFAPVKYLLVYDSSKSDFENEIFLDVKKFFRMNFDFKNECKN